MDPSRCIARPSERSHEGVHGAGLDGNDSATLLPAATRASQNWPRDSKISETRGSLQQARGVQRLQDRALSCSGGFLHQGT